MKNDKVTSELGQVLDLLVNTARLTEGSSFKELALIANVDPGKDFIGASLMGIDFRDQDLRGFDFSNADLTDADFRRANLTGVVLTGADLTGVIGLPEGSIDQYALPVWLNTERLVISCRQQVEKEAKGRAFDVIIFGERTDAKIFQYEQIIWLFLFIVIWTLRQSINTIVVNFTPGICRVEMHVALPAKAKESLVRRIYDSAIRLSSRSISTDIEELVANCNNQLSRIGMKTTFDILRSSIIVNITSLDPSADHVGIAYHLGSGFLDKYVRKYSQETGFELSPARNFA